MTIDAFGRVLDKQLWTTRSVNCYAGFRNRIAIVSIAMCWGMVLPGPGTLVTATIAILDTADAYFEYKKCLGY